MRIGGAYRQVPVASVKQDGQRPDIRLSDGSRLEADRYVFACGPWLGQLFPDVIGSRVQPTRQEVLYFGTPAGDDRFSESRCPVWADVGDRLIYGIPGNLHRGFKVADDTRGPAFDPTNGDRTPSADVGRALRAFVTRRFPALRNAPVLERERLIVDAEAILSLTDRNGIFERARFDAEWPARKPSMTGRFARSSTLTRRLRSNRTRGPAPFRPQSGP